MDAFAEGFVETDLSDLVAVAQQNQSTRTSLNVIRTFRNEFEGTLRTLCQGILDFSKIAEADWAG